MNLWEILMFYLLFVIFTNLYFNFIMLKPSFNNHPIKFWGGRAPQLKPVKFGGAGPPRPPTDRLWPYTEKIINLLIFEYKYSKNRCFYLCSVGRDWRRVYYVSKFKWATRNSRATGKRFEDKRRNTSSSPWNVPKGDLRTQVSLEANVSAYSAADTIFPILQPPQFDRWASVIGRLLAGQSSNRRPWMPWQRKRTWPSCAAFIRRRRSARGRRRRASSMHAHSALHTCHGHYHDFWVLIVLNISYLKTGH